MERNFGKSSVSGFLRNLCWSAVSGVGPFRPLHWPGELHLRSTTPGKTSQYTRLWVVGTPCWLGTLPSVLLGVSNRYFFPSNLPKCLIRKLYSCIVVVFRSFFSNFPVGCPGEWTWSATGSVTSDVRWKRAYSFPVTVFNKTVSGIVQGKRRSVIGYTSPLVPRNSPRSLCKS